MRAVSRDELTPPYLSGVHPLSTINLKRFGSNSVHAWEDERNSGSTYIPRPREYSLITKCIAEFLGDFTFVFVGTMQAFVTIGAGDNIVHAALAHGFTIFVLVAALGHISGGHFNPAVSWAVTCAGKMPYWHFPFYMISQLVGGLAGSFMSALLQSGRPAVSVVVDTTAEEKEDKSQSTFFYMYNETLNKSLLKAIMTRTQLDSSYAGATLLNADNKWWEGLLSETVVTYFLVHTILLTAVDTDKNVLAPLAIGFTLTVDILATGVITGASMNPARSFGPNVVGSIFLDKLPTNFWQHHYIYWAGPFAGATIAVIIYKLFEAREDRLID